MQRGNMQLLATPYVELDAVLGQSQAAAEQQRSCADLMSASVFVSLFFFAASLFCVCATLPQISLFLGVKFAKEAF